MGIIKQQTVKGSFYSYLGVFIGFLTSFLIMPHVLSPEQIGLTGILASFSVMTAQFSILGFNATARIFPFFRHDSRNHNGYLFLACMISVIGFFLFCVIAVLLKDEVVNQNGTDSYLFENYYWYLLPLTFFTLFFNVFDLYSRMLYDTITGRVLNEFTKRVLVLITLLLLVFSFVDFSQFMWLWLLANIIPTLMIAHRLYKNRLLIIRPQFGFLNKSIRTQLIRLSVFGILTGSAPYLIQNIDKYMVTESHGLSSTGIYQIAFNFATIITLPARSLYSIAFTVISEAWKHNDLKSILSIYRKSCITQTITSLYLFILIWANIDNIYEVLPPEYAQGEYVIFFIGLANLIDSATGVNGVILATSRYYMWDSFFTLALAGITIGANLIFIPLYGITGAAIACAVTYAIFNLSRYLFILVIFKLQPFTMKTLWVLISGAVTWYLVYLIPKFSNFIADGLLRASLISVLFGGTIYLFRFSEDINSLIDGSIARIGIKRRSVDSPEE
ncbi:oligosaccharide flippase family protein [Desertivirga xinjiangensis]|uniref:oligosaccharide flippase family protein n=1 Tax=Desertivirga xinjiangensis TaxID=539206 RepID=UPI00210B2AEB|nr:oligosaccharide flippase family protein [Pedobacter xinjiangensis]